MPLPPFLKSPAFLTGIGFFGTGGIGITGWQIWEGANPTGHKYWSRQGFKWNPAVPELQADVSTGVHDTKSSGNKYHLQSYGCFKNFFPGVTVNHSSAPKGETMEPNTIDNATYGGSGDPIGCALMNFSYEWVEDNKISFIFKSEVTVKNDKFGWALWTGAKNITGISREDSDQKDMSYHLIFLNKNNDSWSIIGGYRWADAGFVTGEYHINHLRIITPQKKDWAQEARSNKVKGNKEVRSWSGFWEVSPTEGKEVFQDIEIWADSSGNRGQSAEIFGREFKQNESVIDFSQEPKIDDVRYGYQDKGWTDFKASEEGKSTSKNVGNILNTLYTPWKGKKGSWQEINNYCEKSYSLRHLYEKELMMLQNLCYSK